MNQGFWKSLGGEGNPLWLHRETLTFKGPAAYQNTAVFQIGVNKIPPNFNTLFGAPIWVIQLIYRAHCLTPIWVVWRQRVNAKTIWQGQYQPQSSGMLQLIYFTKKVIIFLI
jgi:hypothetical protein